MLAGGTTRETSSAGGVGRVVARAARGGTVLVSARAESPLRLIRPTFPGTTSAAVCMVTFGGGLVDGDSVALEIVVEAGATLVVFTQASTKVFRGASAQRIDARVEGRLILLPDPIAAFAGAKYTQRIDADLRGDGGCVLLDGFTSGRAAFGERWAMESLDLRATVTHDGRRVVADALRLATTDGAIAARCGRFEAFATLLAVGRSVETIARAIVEEPVAPPDQDLVVASSALPRARDHRLVGAIARVAATSPARALAPIRARLRNLPEIEAVDPFASRY
jgi:urease accessory protein